MASATRCVYTPTRPGPHRKTLLTDGEEHTNLNPTETLNIFNYKAKTLRNFPSHFPNCKIRTRTVSFSSYITDVCIVALKVWVRGLWVNSEQERWPGQRTGFHTCKPLPPAENREGKRSAEYLLCCNSNLTLAFFLGSFVGMLKYCPLLFELCPCRPGPLHGPVINLKEVDQNDTLNW